MKRLYGVLAVLATVFLLASCQAPAVQKKSSTQRQKPKATVQSKAKSKNSSAKSSATKSNGTQKSAKSATDSKAKASKTSDTRIKDASKSARTSVKRLPKLLDLGADRCVPCRMMAPILEELSKEYKGKLVVEFIDVWKNPEAARKYGIRVIPTQIFFDEKGEEFFRHEGYYSKEDILRKFRDQGIDLDKK